MSATAQRLLDRLSQFPETKQEEIAGRFRSELEEVDGDKRWQELFADPRSEKLLIKMATEARKEVERGESEEGGFGGR